MKRVFQAGLALTMALAEPALAHDTWLISHQGTVPAGTVATIDLTSGMGFPVLDHAIEPERVEHLICRLAGTKFEVTQRDKGAKSLRFSSRLEAPGIATVWVDLKPKSIELKPDEVMEYLDEIHAGEAIRKAWAAAPEPKRWRENYVKHSKIFVRVGEPATDLSWSEPTGGPLEFVPGKDPTTLRQGNQLSVRVLRHGLPMVGFSVGIVHAGDLTATDRTTDKDGQITFALDRAGLWLLRGTELRRSSGTDAEWESDFATLTIAVLM